MEYHEPDHTWTIWCDSYESFVETFVVKGRFHPLVPEAVVNSYKVVEYIMAHSYYFYPMYDEAMLRLMGIFEMAVKNRCTELKIPLKGLNDKIVLKEKTLGELIKDLHKKEQGKQLYAQLDWLRRVRNLLSHPENYGFIGGNIRSSVQEVVNVLNKLFLSESLLISFTEERKRMAALFKIFSKNLWVLSYEVDYYLVEKCSIRKAARVENKWKYLLVAHPVYSNFASALSEHKYLPLFILGIENIEVKGNSFTATDIASGLSISIQKSSKDKDMLVYKKHLSDWEAADKHNRFIYTHSADMDIGHKESDLDYQFLYQSDTHNSSLKNR